MKTAISIPNNVFNSAEQLARSMGKSRSELYTKAIESYVGKHRKDEITKKLNEIYSNNNSTVDPELNIMQFKSLPREDW